MRCSTPSLARSKFDSDRLRPLTPSRSGLAEQRVPVSDHLLRDVRTQPIPLRNRRGVGDRQRRRRTADDDERSRALRMIGRKPHRDGPTRLRSDDVRRFDAGLVHHLRDERGEVRQGIFEAARNGGVSKSGQVRPDQPILLRHPRHPRVPFDAGFVVAVDEDHGFRLAPGLPQPVFSVEVIFLVIVLSRRLTGRLCAPIADAASASDRAENPSIASVPPPTCNNFRRETFESLLPHHHLRIYELTNLIASLKSVIRKSVNSSIQRSVRPCSRRNWMSSLLTCSGCSCCTQCPAPSTRWKPTIRVHAVVRILSTAPGV